VTDLIPEMLHPFNRRYALLVALLTLALVSVSSADEWNTVVDLRGKWKFEVGDGMNRAAPSFNDAKWGTIVVPAAWEDEGYPGYDGYAWYRKHFQTPAGAGAKALVLRLGCVDDVSEIYLNGTLIGAYGGFPPDVMTAYNTDIVIPIPPRTLSASGENVLAVRVYDDQLGGGIVQGTVGLYESPDYLVPDVAIAGMWKFKTGDSEKWIDPSFDDSRWEKIFAPALWETQGYPEYDGMAWYRTRIRIPAELAGKRLVLLLGRIDDFDETYVNGILIGRTGTMRIDPRRNAPRNEYRQLRAYDVPPGVLKPGQDNVIAVRVFDGRIGGGIYEGPLGITTSERYAEWNRTQVRTQVRTKSTEDKFIDFMKWLFE